jgi:NAD(P)-dependent dehydrogenase (short-subunit alcohol dehydrogenase family)
MNDLFSIEGKSALITGGSRGIGLMMAKGYVRAGAKVYISSRKVDVCQEVAEELSKEGTCTALPADLTKNEDIEKLVHQLKEKEKKLDVLINNAGKAWHASLETFPEIGWDSVLNINIKSIFNLTRKLLSLLTAAANHENPARVINIGSIAADISDSMENYSYGVSKAGVHWLTKSLAIEFAEKHITVNAIAPGRFPSEMTAGVVRNKEQYKAEVKFIPLHRWGRESDIAGVSIFLASPSASYITGAIIPLDGGFRIA